MIKTKTCAIVVTYNRLVLLKEVVEALLKVDDNLDKIIVINNASTDDTENYLNNISVSNSKVEQYLMSENLGGAGGFYTGLKYAFEQGYDYMWLMDDDSIVTPSSLDYLKEAFEKVDNVGYSCSKVVWTDNKPHVMNIPEVSSKNDNGVAFFEDKGFINVNSCSFVSMLIHRETIKNVGLPYKDFFIWGDDLEYSKRIIKHGYKGLFCEKSLVIHKTAENYSANIQYCKKTEFWKIEYGIRNRTFMYKSFKDYKYIVLYFLLNIYRSLKRKNNKFRALYLVLSSSFKGLFFKPKKQMV
ncbi:Glycosyltransferase, GT2 family [Mesonia phycicola]|uniref:Glycosyltransferase, GT2 family n=1 Tax=Mesonia phycicola TaxID=579105 RepID=A0A1M6D1S4_9FLAO|nr:glycosyltransferase family 2 protein [Mesonia phycicola]SHI67024.1 Glycosyltransferase, GT2 family [Mesonia phycicola]